MVRSSDTPPEPLHPRLYLGTSSWSNRDWEGVFYPEGTPPGDYLAYYATRYRAVEIDATFYRLPTAAMTEKWRRVLPEGFAFAAKVPRTITHDKRLVDCGEDLRAFLAAMDPLEDRLGPLLFQFPYFNKASGVTASDFRARLETFLPTVPAGYRFALEIRNKTWIGAPLLDLLRRHGVAWTLLDHPWMPRIGDLMREMDPVTADFTYVRWLGDRRGIEKKTRTWNRLIVDRGREMHDWTAALKSLLDRNMVIFGFFNNHYAGYAPGSIDLLRESWTEPPA
jgi:uncharacterized protein YecE (DUF72 family)